MTAPTPSPSDAILITWPAIAALAAVAMVIISLLGVLNKKFRQIERRLEAHMAENIADHAASRKQITDIALTISENYVRTRDFQLALRQFNETMSEARKDIGALHNRIDELFRDGWRRPGGR